MSRNMFTTTNGNVTTTVYYIYCHPGAGVQGTEFWRIRVLKKSFFKKKYHMRVTEYNTILPVLKKRPYLFVLSVESDPLP